MMGRASNLFGNERGAAIIELALIAPVLAIAVAGIVDISSAYSRKLALEQGAQRAIEKIMQTTEDSTVETTLANEAICQVNGTNTDGSCKTSPINASNVTVTWRQLCVDTNGVTTSTATTTNSNTYDNWAVCASGTTTDYIEIALTDKYTPAFPIHFSGYNGDGTYHLSATAGMRTK